MGPTQYLIMIFISSIVSIPLWVMFSPFLCLISRFGEPFLEECRGGYKIVREQYVFGLLPIKSVWGYDELGCGGWSNPPEIFGDNTMPKEKAIKQLNSLKNGDNFTYIL